MQSDLEECQTELGKKEEKITKLSRLVELREKVLSDLKNKMEVASQSTMETASVSKQLQVSCCLAWLSDK